MALLILWATAESVDPIAFLVNYGVAGVVIGLLVTGQLRTKFEVRGLERQIEAKDQVISEFQAQLSTNTLPALARSAQILETFPASEREAYREMRQASAGIAQLIQELKDRVED